MCDDASLTRTRIEQLIRDYQRVVQRERAAEQLLLEGYRARLATLAEQHAQAQPLPPKPLTIPAIFGSSYRENFVSDYLAYALDPAKNGIGEAPLMQLLHLCGIDVTDLSISNVRVHREYSLETGQIDFLLEWEDELALGIENKILSSEGKEQTVRYARAFRRQFKDTAYHLVYLTREGERAGSRAFQPISYAQLVEALRQVRVASDVDPRRRILWEDLLEHLEVYIVMSDPEHFEFSEKAQLYLDHLDMIVDLEDALERDWGDAMSYVGGQVAAHLDGGPWTTRFGTTKYHQLWKPSWRPPEGWVHYEYFFSTDDFRQQEFTLMIDVEGKEQRRLLSLFDRRHPDLAVEYQERGLSYRPKKRSIAIAWKMYPVSRDIDQIAQAFIDAIDEFRFLEEEIDDVLAEWQQQ